MNDTRGPRRLATCLPKATKTSNRLTSRFPNLELRLQRSRNEVLRIPRCTTATLLGVVSHFPTGVALHVLFVAASTKLRRTYANGDSKHKHFTRKTHLLWV